MTGIIIFLTVLLNKTLYIFHSINMMCTGKELTSFLAIKALPYYIRYSFI